MQVTLLAKPALTENWQDFYERATRDQLQGTAAERLIEAAGRICYDSLGKGRASVDYHAHIVDVGHGSVLEHAQFTFLIQGVSRNLTHELVRHRVGTAISQRSTRYVDEADYEFCKHPEDVEMTKKQHNLLEAAREVYHETYLMVLNKLVTLGYGVPYARKQARGAARQYLPGGASTELVWSANVRSLLHICKLRGHESADKEIRTLAVELVKIMKEEVPSYFKEIDIQENAVMLDNVRSI